MVIDVVITLDGVGRGARLTEFDVEAFRSVFCGRLRADRVLAPLHSNKRSVSHAALGDLRLVPYLKGAGQSEESIRFRCFMSLKDHTSPFLLELQASHADTPPRGWPGSSAALRRQTATPHPHAKETQ
jgi:hypothetical protein